MLLLDCLPVYDVACTHAVVEDHIDYWDHLVGLKEEGVSKEERKKYMEKNQVGIMQDEREKYIVHPKKFTKVFLDCHL